MMGKQKSDLYNTSPLLDRHTPRRFPADPTGAVTAYAPPSEDLIALSTREVPSGQELLDFPEPASGPRSTLAADAPDWMRAARALSDALEANISRGSVEPTQLAAIERAWAAWTLGGVTTGQILRVAHLVRRAHTAIRETNRTELDLAYRDCAGVLYGGLPSALRQGLPFERVILVVRQLREEADGWAAVVEGTAELLGWRDYARMCAASIIRIAIESSG
jgi:hypothetical protein